MFSHIVNMFFSFLSICNIIEEQLNILVHFLNKKHIITFVELVVGILILTFSFLGSDRSITASTSLTLE